MGERPSVWAVGEERKWKSCGAVSKRTMEEQKIEPKKWNKNPQSMSFTRPLGFGRVEERDVSNLSSPFEEKIHFESLVIQILPLHYAWEGTNPRNINSPGGADGTCAPCRTSSRIRREPDRASGKRANHYLIFALFCLNLDSLLDSLTKLIVFH